MMLVYTSITKNYLPKARVLAISIKKFHPDWYFVLLLSDLLPEDFNLDNEPFDEILLANELNIPNFKSWAFCHTMVELCTAVKGPAVCLLAKRGKFKKIMYLDPDIKVFNSLAYLDKKLDTYDILLTPHLLDPETDDLSIKDNEICALKHGTYNLGFFAVKTSGQGLQFINWWSERLIKFCYDDIPGGLFTDQRWCDLAPVFFDNLLIIRDRGFNVATWNISHRVLSRTSKGDILAGDCLLRFYHFTSFDNGDGYAVLLSCEPNQKIAHEIWDEYKSDLIKQGQLERSSHWIYGSFDNGEIISKEARRVYRDRDDLKRLFTDPFETPISNSGFYGWWINNKSKNNNNKTYKSRFLKWLNEPRSFICDLGLVFYVLKKDGPYVLFRKILSNLKGK